MNSNIVIGFIFSFILIIGFFYQMFTGVMRLTRKYHGWRLFFTILLILNGLGIGLFLLPLVIYYITTLFIPPNAGAIGFGLLEIFIGRFMLIPLGIFDVIFILVYLVVIYHRAMRKDEAAA